MAAASISGPSPSAHSKPCTVCQNPRDVLIRCQIDDSRRWHFVCGKCWRDVSGGEVDGDREHKYYRYGGSWSYCREVLCLRQGRINVHEGMWKNKHEAVSAKIKRKKKSSKKEEVAITESAQKPAAYKPENEERDESPDVAILSA